MKQDDFGSGGRGRFPRVRVTADASGMVWLYVWHNAREYNTGYPHKMYITAGAAAKLLAALIPAVPRAKQQAAARRKRRSVHDRRHPTPVQSCRLCAVQNYSQKAYA
ncbi:MAG TPA: hypothetical protein VF595_16080 [Tepidisphaeraceae bacterium]|jgi:hypothetical protein